jgi:hypothetical protein
MNKQTSGNSLPSREFQKTKKNLFSRTVASPVKDKTSLSSGLRFPWKVHSMLDNAETEGYGSVLSWDGDNGFIIHDKKAFVEEIVPRYFSQTKYKSFQRMLNMWGYERVCEGPRKGAYTHTHFRRGDPDLCNLMKCQKIKRRHTAPSSLYGSELDAPKKSLVDAFAGRTFHVVEGLQDSTPMQVHSLDLFSLVDDEMLNDFDLDTDAAIFP